jgi:ATP-dependent DNA helicase RecG
MRPALLNALFAAASGLKGIGPKLEVTLASLLRPGIAGAGTGARILDLLLHLPSGLIDRSHRPQISELPESGIVTVEVTIGRHKPPPRHNKRVPYRVEAFDSTGSIGLVYFHAFADTLNRMLPVGETRFISGAIEWFQGSPQMAHPDHVLTAAEFEQMPKLEPVYPLTSGVTLKTLGKAMVQALERLPELSEWQDRSWLSRQQWPSFGDALKAVHRPTASDVLEPTSAERSRLAYDELLANQLALALVRRHMRKTAGRATRGDGALRAAIIAKLPFRLTDAQESAIAEITADMASGDRMLRLLQGDVGSGKTVVALMALAAAVEAGGQGVLMVPTDILARQHFATLTRLTEGLGISVDLLTGREKGEVRARVLERIAMSQSGIVIGTHALFQEGVEFADLRLVVIDEQHRFGVHQRLALQAKAGTATDVLVMTATPIPRTLALTRYGDMDVSRLMGKPVGREPIDTRTVPLDRVEELVRGLARQIEAGARAYWVCPLVAESEVSEDAAAELRFAELNAAFPERVGLVHGRMKGAEKDAVMARFKAGEISILVSTTVIEVGVDVPEATVMVIENAERFGLAQLHQLRGRVGRGAGKSTCILLYKGPLSETAKARLSILRESEDGFRIAEEDLRLRGAGEMLGTRQSGLPEFRLADLSVHGELLAAARDDVAMTLERDPLLQEPRGEQLRVLLYVFERDDAVRLIGAG